MPKWKRPLLLEASSENVIHSAASMDDLGGDGRNLDWGPANTLSSTWLPTAYLPLSLAFMVYFPITQGTPTHLLCSLITGLVRGSFLVWWCQDKAIMMIKGKKPIDTDNKKFP